MKLQFIRMGVVLALCAGTWGCSDDDDPVAPVDTYDYTTILADYSSDVVVATYEDMKAKGEALVTAIEAFNADPTNQTRLDEAAVAWRAMREPWESSEAFLFGPAEFLSLDPALDSWPVDRNQLDNVLASSFELTADFIRDGLGPALRGFHTVEYLLFRDGSPRTAASVTVREREYLLSAAEVLAGDAATLADEWTGGFASEFANAGKSGSRYRTQIDAATEIVDGIIAILDEVANGKIADPVAQQDIQFVESQFSWNSIKDFQDNIRSARNAYIGGYHNGSDGQGLDVFVASKDAALDARLQGEFQAAIEALAAVPVPFEENLDAATEITAAQAAIVAAMNTLLEDVRPLLTDCGCSN